MMKKVVFILCLGVFFISCKKEFSYEGGEGSNPTNPTYYMQANIDGVPKTFNFSTAAIRSSVGNGENALDLMGYATSSLSDLRGIFLTIEYTTVPPASQSFYLEYTQSPDYVIYGVYNPNNSLTTVYTAGYGYPSSAIPLIIAIDQLTATEITGTFSGNFYLTDFDANGDVEEIHNTPVTITNGKFKLPLL